MANSLLVFTVLEIIDLSPVKVRIRVIICLQTMHNETIACKVPIIDYANLLSATCTVSSTTPLF